MTAAPIRLLLLEDNESDARHEQGALAEQASGKFAITLQGKGGHGASPFLAKDPVVAAAHIITALQTIVARNVNALDTAVVSVTSVKGGEAFNVIPDSVKMLGTIRTYKP